MLGQFSRTETVFGVFRSVAKVFSVFGGGFWTIYV